MQLLGYPHVWKPPCWQPFVSLRESHLACKCQVRLQNSFVKDANFQCHWERRWLCGSCQNWKWNSRLIKSARASVSKSCAGTIFINVQGVCKNHQVPSPPAADGLSTWGNQKDWPLGDNFLDIPRKFLSYLISFSLLLLLLLFFVCQSLFSLTVRWFWMVTCCMVLQPQLFFLFGKLNPRPLLWSHNVRYLQASGSWMESASKPVYSCPRPRLVRDFKMFCFQRYLGGSQLTHICWGWNYTNQESTVDTSQESLPEPQYRRPVYDEPDAYLELSRANFSLGQENEDDEFVFYDGVSFAADPQMCAEWCGMIQECHSFQFVELLDDEVLDLGFCILRASPKKAVESLDESDESETDSEPDYETLDWRPRQCSCPKVAGGAKLEVLWAFHKSGVKSTHDSLSLTRGSWIHSLTLTIINWWDKLRDHYKITWGFPRIGVPPNHPFIAGIVAYKPFIYWGCPHGYGTAPYSKQSACKPTNLGTELNTFSAGLGSADQRWAIDKIYLAFPPLAIRGAWCEKRYMYIVILMLIFAFAIIATLTIIPHLPGESL